ncbi:hypothetical protein C1881_06725 [Slackia isoflavoniconvertens]|uniref:Uncharacterized protein n=1 Tax=Slackia isoflavoniconvertens TaxID=572010 RepID=A0A369LIV6_9ACTN|nr:hypothetical protein C1881_06725 [Slackia isoflavoniconvertens]
MTIFFEKVREKAWPYGSAVAAREGLPVEQKHGHKGDEHPVEVHVEAQAACLLVLERQQVTKRARAEGNPLFRLAPQNKSLSGSCLQRRTPAMTAFATTTTKPNNISFL